MSEKDFKQTLSPDAYRVLREKGTEPPFSGPLLHESRQGDFVCGACGQLLFHSDTKFDSGSGWPSFTAPADRANVKLETDDSFGMRRTEISCADCGSHLGHVFDDGPKQAGGRRYCINSLSLQFDPEEA